MVTVSTHAPAASCETVDLQLLAPPPDVSYPVFSARPAGDLVRPEKRHIPELDGLRAIAVALVVFSHLFFDYQHVPTTGTPNRLLNLWLHVSKSGWIGVDIFFVLSGFLITGVLLDALGKPHFYRNFYMRRVLRIFPLYYLTLVVMLFWYGFPWKFFGLSSIFMANISIFVGVPMALGPLWSLSVEEHFYLLWPWLVRWVKPFWLVVFCFVLILGEPIVRLIGFRHGHFLGYASWFRFDGMAMGALLAILLRSRYAGKLKAVGTAAIVLPLAIAAAGARFGIGTRDEQVGASLLYTIVSLLTAGVIALALARPNTAWSAPLRWRSLKFLADISFCVYLVHIFVIDAFHLAVARIAGLNLDQQAVLHAPAFYMLECVFVWTVTMAIGWASMRYFEGPIRRHRISFQ